MKQVCLTEDEILKLPNDYELGKLVRNRLSKEKNSENNIKENEDNQKSEDGGN
jgi:hypothetical protein